MKLCDWGWRERHQEDLRRRIAEQTSIIPPFLAWSISTIRSLQLQCAENWIKDQIGIPPQPTATGPAWRNDRIKVAYLSADFRRHATAYLIAELFERHDRERFEMIGVSFGPDDESDMRARLVGAFDRFLDVASSSDDEVAQLLNRSRGRHRRRPAWATPNMHAPAFWPIARHRSRRAISAFPVRRAPTSSTTLSPTRSSPPFDQQPFFTEKDRSPAGLLSANDTTRKIARAYRRARNSACPPRASSSAASTRAGRSRRQYSMSGCGCSRRSRAACCGCSRQHGRRGEPARGGGGARDRSGASRLRRPLGARRASRAPSAGRPVPRHAALQRAHDGERRAVGRTAAVDLPRRILRGRVAASLLNAVGLPELVTNLEDYEALALRLATDDSLRCRFRERLEGTRRLVHYLIRSAFGDTSRPLTRPCGRFATR